MRAPSYHRSYRIPLGVAAWCIMLWGGVLGGCAEPSRQGSYPLAAVDRGLPSVDQTELSPDDLPRGRKTLRYGVTPYLGKEITKKAFSPIAASLSERLGVPVQFVLSDSYDDLLNLLKRGQVDLVQLSPLSYVKARKQVPGLRLVASSTSFGSDTYSSLMVVRAGSTLRALRDVIPLDVRRERQARKRRGDSRIVPVPEEKKVRFGYVHRTSASGFLLPYQAFLSHGIAPRRDLIMTGLGSHEAAIEALIRGDVDLVAVSSGTLNNVRRGVIIGEGDLRILYKAGRVPYDAVCTSPAVPASGAAKIAAAFGALSTRTAAGRKALAEARGVTGWAGADDARYTRLERMMPKVNNAELRYKAEIYKAKGLPDAVTAVRP